MTARKTGLLAESLANKSVVDRVVDQLTGAIINGELKPGDKIPTELELAEAFQVGRNSVREAIKVLQAFGVVDIRRSEGTFVSDEFNKRMLDPMLYGLLLQKDSREIHDLRQVFDTGVLHVAISNASETGLAAIRQRLRELRDAASEKQVSPDKLLAADMAFHDAVVAAAQNPLLSSIAGYIDRITIPSRVTTVRDIVDSGQLGAFLDLHDRMLDVLESRDELHIARTVKDHYQFWRQQMAQ